MDWGKFEESVPFSSQSNPDFNPIVADENAFEAVFPCMYEVILLNDEHTPMNFVVKLIQDLFHKSSNDAEEVVLDVHKSGQSACGVYTREVAETKMIQVINEAREHGFPLKCIVNRVT